MSLGTKDKFYSLSQISAGVKQAINMKFGDVPVWIVAEIADMNVRKGHCYLSLVEKLPGSAAPICELKGIIWANKFERISNIFKDQTGNHLATNTSILFQAIIRYDIKWGLSLTVEDIEPRYTIGLLQQERDRTVAKLKSEGVYDSNRSIPFPLAPMRIAVISAKDSRGYEDFIQKLNLNQYNYKYHVDLYPSLLQGEQAAGQMVQRLIEIYNNINSYDIVVIVRGGGGSIDLNCFNDYKLSRAVARFPIPVLTGIGHTINISIVDEVAFAHRITPTDAAAYIVEKTRIFETLLEELSDKVQEAAVDILIEEEQSLVNLSNLFRIHVAKQLAGQNEKISNKTIQIKSYSGNLIKHCNVDLITKASKVGSITKNQIYIGNERLKQLIRSIRSVPFNYLKSENSSINEHELSIKHLNPVNILKRGFSITQVNGKAVRNAKQLSAGSKIKTIFYEGYTESEVKKIGS